MKAKLERKNRDQRSRCSLVLEGEPEEPGSHVYVKLSELFPNGREFLASRKATDCDRGDVKANSLSTTFFAVNPELGCAGPTLNFSRSGRQMSDTGAFYDNSNLNCSRM